MDLPHGPLTVEFDDVDFSYPSRRRGLARLAGDGRRGRPRGGASRCCTTSTFRAEPGQLVALVGPSGAGKTTITGLVAAALRPDAAAAVRLGGLDVRDVSLDSLHDVVGVVTQDAHLFHDTIRANLLYARPDATEAQTGRRRCSPPRSGTWSTRLPEGLDTVVGDRGHRLSGGEKQRLAIARLLLKAPAWSSSTRPPRTSTASPRWPSSGPSTPRWSAAPRW